MLQRSNEWFEARKGKFTASQIYRLLGKETLAKTKQSIDTYAFEKAVEIVYGVEEDGVVSFDMQRGIDLEPLAFRRFQELKSFEFVNVEETGFHVLNKDSGASPDGLLDNNENLEIKCPRRTKFFKLVANGTEQVDKNYIAQMQHQMAATGTERTNFFNFYIEEGIEYWHNIVIERDEEMIELIKERTEKAAIVRDEYVKKLKENSQC